MFEIFFFVNPIGINCYENEQSIINAIKTSDKKVDYHIIPMANITTIRNDMRVRGLSASNLSLFNRISFSTFSAIKDYHSIKLLKGNKLARKFLLELQSSINDDNNTYSHHLTKEILEDLGISYKAFVKTRSNEYTHFSMLKDLQLAEKFNVETTPTTFIYNYDTKNSDYVIEGKIEEADVQKILKTDKFSKPIADTNCLHLL